MNEVVAVLLLARMLPNIAKRLAEVFTTSALRMCHNLALIEQGRRSHLLISHEEAILLRLVDQDGLLGEATLMTLSQQVLLLRMHVDRGVRHALLVVCIVVDRRLRADEASIHSCCSMVRLIHRR